MGVRGMSAATRPMYRKYYEVWAAHREKYGPRTALLYQVGGFFEIYDTENLTTGTTQANIREIAELCQLSLTVHSVDSEGASATGSAEYQTLFGGFPEHALGKFEKILVQAGFTVVVVVQRKGKTGAVEERVVDHIASPGCYVEGAKERRLVGCVLESLTDGPAALRRVYWGIAALDVATGRIWFAEGADRDRLHQFLCIHPPAELVIWSDGLPAAVSLSESLKAACAATHLRCLGPASAAIEEAALDHHWSPVRKHLDWIYTQPQSRRCLAALMDFAAEHVPSSLRALELPEAWVPTGEVRLGNAALEQLGLLSLRDGDASGGAKQSLLGMMDQCRSIAGRRLLRARLMRPICDIPTLNSRLDRIDAVSAAPADKIATTERALRSLYDMSRLWRRLELGTASLNDMACLMRSYEAATSLLEAWTDTMGSMADAQLFLGWMTARWDTAALIELTRDGGSVPVARLPWFTGIRRVADTAFAEGQAIREEAALLCKEWSGLGRGEQLYLDDAEGGGFRITGTKRRVASVLAVLRDSGDMSATTTAYKSSALLETAGLNALSDRHRKWYAGWVATWGEQWRAAIAEVVEKGRVAHAAIEAWCAELDVAWTVARLGREWLWKRPIFVESDEGFLEVTRLRHPILERLTQVPYVAHSVGLGGSGASAVEGSGAVDVTWTSRGLLLYGMNASGKSSLMKALGLCALLAQCGFPVPASSCRIAPFTAIFTRILGNDNLWAGMSSFAVEMTEFREILRFADARSLVLGDELCSGTESLSATALVAAGVETLAGRGTKFVFATHLHELATLPDIAGLSGVRAVHLRVHYDAAEDRLVYDRHLAPGSGSALYGLEVCRALDLPTGYLERATVLRKSLAGWQAPKQSAYSTAAVVDACGVCGARGAAARLETHHIRPQAERAVAAAEGIDVDAVGNLVCLCAACHDAHHGGLLRIRGWRDTSSGPLLDFERMVAGERIEHVDEAGEDDVTAWIREQRQLKIRVPTIKRMAKQIFGVELSDKQIRAVN
jgi:DNA mismatch repair protein MutS